MPPPAARVLLEIAVDDIDGAIAAAQAGADRLELCAALSEGGLTPSAGVLAAVKARVHVPVFSMIRPRGGGFTYSGAELEAMAKDIEIARAHGADGFVFGTLTRQGAIDGKAMRTLMAVAQGLPVTFHRAFDTVHDPLRALDELIDLGCARVLTSGGAATAAMGQDRLRALLTRAGEHISVLAGGGVRTASLDAVLATGVREVHAGPRTQAAPATGGHRGTDAAEVRALAARLR